MEYTGIEKAFLQDAGIEVGGHALLRGERALIHACLESHQDGLVVIAIYYQIVGGDTKGLKIVPEKWRAYHIVPRLSQGCTILHVALAR